MADLVFLDPRRRPRPLLRTLVGDVLRRHRQDQRRTLADVARAARVSMPYLSEVERGRKEASSEVLAAVCAALRIDLSELVGEVWRDLAVDPATGRRDLAPDPASSRRDLRDPHATEDLRGAGDPGGAKSLRGRGLAGGDLRRSGGALPGRGSAGAPAVRGGGRPARGSSDVVLLAA